MNLVKRTIFGCVLLLFGVLLYFGPLILVLSELTEEGVSIGVGLFKYIFSTTVLIWLPLRIIEASVKKLKELNKQQEKEKKDEQGS
jgi:hypothetical protein